jgi:TonB-linked SusC/RagA family outer membrane protein
MKRKPKNLRIMKISISLLFVFLFVSMSLSAAKYDSGIRGMSNDFISQQSRSVVCVVTDAQGPVVGANVMVKGTTNGSITDANGRVSLSNVPSNAVLVVSFVGYLTQEISLGNRKTVSVLLKEDTKVLDEVVVIGYGTVRKSDLTGSLSTVTSDKIKNLPQGSVSNILQGKAAGVNITSTSGAGNMNIRIRGITSLNKSSEPLWVVDGVIGGTIGNFYDIENIEVLKDASSTSIYGSQGANGVILVTTKRPKEGIKVTFDARYGWNTIRKKPDLLNSYEYAYALNDVEGANTVSDADMAAYKAGTKGIDWLDLMTQTGFNQNYNLNISGGTKKTKYSVTAWVGNSKGQWITTTSRNYNVKSTLETEIAPWLTFSGYMYGGITKGHNSTSQDQFSDILEFSPCMELQTENGTYNLDPYGSLGNSPYGEVYAKYTDTRSSNMNGFANLKFKIIDGLTFSVEGFYTHSQDISRFFQSSKLYPNAPSEANNYNGQSYTWRNINNLTYLKDFGDHHLTAMGVVELTKSKSSWLKATANSLVNESTTYWDLASAGTYEVSNGFSNSAMSSIFGRLIYSYKGKYLFTGTMRADAPSQFKDKYKWGYFPSVAVGWNIAEESFMNKDIIQQLKLRASVGTIGNHGVGAYATYATMSRAYASYGTNTQYWGYWPASNNNPDIHWEKTLQYDLGFDLSILNQRLSLSSDFYLKNTTDLLFEKELPDYNGGGTVWTNLGKLQNKGLEFTLNAVPVQSKDFNWETTLTATYTNNIVKDLGDVDYIIPDASRGGMYQGGLFILKVGKPVGSFYLQKWAGFNDQGANLYNTTDGGTTTENNAANRVITGNSIPKWLFGWNNTLTYKNWDMSVLFRATSKYDRLNLSRYIETCMVGASRFISTREAYYRNWDKVADKSKALFPSLTNSNNQYVPGSTQWLENAAFLRCQNLTIGYSIPQKLTKFAKVHLSLSAENLFVLTKYKGLDPETVSEVSSEYQDTTFGLDRGSFPIPRTYTFIVRLEY